MAWNIFSVCLSRSIESATENVFHMLLRNVYGCERDRTNFAILNFSAAIDLLKKRRKRSSAEFLEEDYVLGFYPKHLTWQRNSDYRFCYWPCCFTCYPLRHRRSPQSHLYSIYFFMSYEQLRLFNRGIRLKNAIKINFITVVTNYLHYYYN